MKCLVTKLKGTVNNNTLTKVGELRIKFSKVQTASASTQYLNISVKSNQTISIVGEGYFTDSALSQNKGKTISISGANNTVYVSNTGCEVSVPDKYNITDLSFGNNDARIFNKELDLNDLSYSPLNSLYLPYSNLTGSLDGLRNITSILSLNIIGANDTGDLDSLKGLTSLTSLSLANTNVTGDLDSLKGLTSLTSLSLANTNVTGDISSLQRLTSLATLNLGCVNTMIIGNIDIFKSFAKLSSLSLKYSKLSGDIATLPSNCRFLSMQNDKGSSVTWSTRPSSAKIIAMEGDIELSNVDVMLQNQANCQVGIVPSDETAYKSIITTLGTRTSASDDAVTTLQQKGYTVRIAKA